MKIDFEKLLKEFDKQVKWIYGKAQEKDREKINKAFDNFQKTLRSDEGIKIIKDFEEFRSCHLRNDSEATAFALALSKMTKV